jgi:hypothetical protein
MDAPPEELVSVLVPRKHVMDVYAYLTQLTERGFATSNGSQAPPSAEWEPELLRRMYRESPPAMQDILGALAARPGNWLSAVELAAAIRDKPEADANTVAGTLGAFRRRCRNRYGRPDWPFSNHWDHVRGRFRYSMTPEVAAEITAAASS